MNIKWSNLKITIVFPDFPAWKMLNLYWNFNESQPVSAYKRYASKNRVYSK